MPSDKRDWPAEIAAVRGDGYSSDKYTERNFARSLVVDAPNSTLLAIDARDALIDALASELAAADEDYDRIEAEREDADDAMLAAREEADAYAKLNAEVGGELAHALEREARLRGLLGDLLLSADASWEDCNEGHDWKDACEAARSALDGDKGEG